MKAYPNNNNGEVMVRYARQPLSYDATLEVFFMHGGASAPGKYNGHSVMTDFTFTTVEDGTVPQGEGIPINEHMAQRLMDDMWFAGIRPSAGNFSNDAEKFMQAHLEDLRQINQRLLNAAVIEKEALYSPLITPTE